METKWGRPDKSAPADHVLASQINGDSTHEGLERQRGLRPELIARRHTQTIEAAALRAEAMRGPMAAREAMRLDNGAARLAGAALQTADRRSRLALLELAGSLALRGALFARQGSRQ